MPTLKEAAEEFTTQAHEAQKVFRSFADLMSQISEVEAVLGMLDDGAFSLWTVTDEASMEVEDRIYEMEGRLMDMFPSEGFDFHLTERRGRPLEEIVSLDHFAVHRLHERTERPGRLTDNKLHTTKNSSPPLTLTRHPTWIG